MSEEAREYEQTAEVWTHQKPMSNVVEDGGDQNLFNPAEIFSTPMLLTFRTDQVYIAFVLGHYVERFTSGSF